MTLGKPSEVPQHPQPVFRTKHYEVTTAPPGPAPVAEVEDGQQAGCCSAAHAAVCCDPAEKRSCSTPSGAAGDCGCR